MAVQSCLLLAALALMVLPHHRPQEVLADYNYTPEASAKTSEEILNDIVNYGLDRTRYLVEVLEKEIYDEGLALKKTDPAHFVAVFNKQTSKAKELSKYGYATLEASSLLTKQ